VKTAKFLNLAFRIEKLKTKYKNLAQCKLESSVFSTALLAIYLTLCKGCILTNRCILTNKRKKASRTKCTFGFAKTQANSKNQKSIFLPMLTE
jgi:hypothetical protein